RAGVAVETDYGETRRDAAIRPDAQGRARAVDEGHRPLAETKGDIDRELLVRALLAAGGAEPLAALAAGAAGEAPEFDEVHADARCAIGEMNRASGHGGADQAVCRLGEGRALVAATQPGARDQGAAGGGCRNPPRRRRRPGGVTPAPCGAVCVLRRHDEQNR